MAWITTEDVFERWIPAVNDDAEVLGYIKPSQARKLNIRIFNIEKPLKYLKDPYIKYHSEILVRSGVITSGKDLNEVQSILLFGYIINEKESLVETRKLDFESMLFANNPEMYKNYKEHEEQRRLVENPEYEQIRPKSLQELLSMFDGFDEEIDAIQDKDKKASGWLDDLLEDEEIGQIRD